MTKTTRKSTRHHMKYSNVLLGLAAATSMAVISMPAAAQQTGSIRGYVTNTNGAAMPGVTVEATSSVLPQGRTTTSGATGRYQLPLLPPGAYELTFKNSDGSVLKRNAFVLLQQKIKVDVAFGAPTDEVVVTGTKTYVDTGHAALKNTITSEAITGVPVGQEYRDLLKLIPGVQYSEDAVRGPNAGGSGQDNVYQFDGVDVSLPMFGTLSAEPSSHDIDQVSVVRGGATAIGFNRSGGFLVNTISKRGTNEFQGEIGYRVQSSGMTADRKADESEEQFKEDKRWLTASVGGPVIEDKLFFYGSYYRPTVTRKNRSNAYGDVPEFKSERDEYFAKLTFAPTSNLLLDASYRTSDRSSRNSGVGEFTAPSVSTGSDAGQDIAIVEGSWVVDDKSSFNFKFTNFKNTTSQRPDTLFDVRPTLGGAIDIGNLGSLGRLSVPILRTGETAYNNFVQPIINQYGFTENGALTGGGTVGGYYRINDQDFSRQSFELGYDRNFTIGGTSHDIHIGYQYQAIEEDLARFSNGYGRIYVPGGRTTTSDGTPIFVEVRTYQTGIVGANGETIVPQGINSRAELQSFEINDTIEKGDFTINVGAVISNDTLFGQGLREKTGTLSGYEVAAGNRYKMHETKWGDMIQPRFGVNWDYSDTSSLYVNYARYHPSASSLARAASWDRNLSRELRLRYDQNGNFIESSAVRSSSGKVFQDDLKPRKIDEYLLGWNKQVSDQLTLRTHVRHRAGANFWEDTGNAHRLVGNAPADIEALGLYIPNLADIRAEIGGSSYVIAQLDNAHTEFYEVNAEAEYFGDGFYLSGSYVWSHYYGNFDQDNTTTSNDGNIFIGSSNIADGPGRQLWDFKEGDLRGDRRHQLKLYGFYELDWNASVGAYAVFQSGQPWEAWDVEVYRAYTGSGSDTIRYAEPAGSRRTDGHFKLDLNYTQNFEVFGGRNIELRADLFNVFNSQTGYNIQPKVNSAGFGDPRSFYRPRRIQLSMKAEF